MSFSSQARKLKSYYRWHAPIYDATRWSFLFGRRRMIRHLPDLPPRPRILEVGCGTARNIININKLWPQALITGIDISPHMLAVANRKAKAGNIRLVRGKYGFDQHSFAPFDLIFLSYSLTMAGGEIERILEQTITDLAPGGRIAVVDFHQTTMELFRRWMATNHVRMDGSLLPRLKDMYRPLQSSIQGAYFGLWSYFLFVGSKK